MNRKKQQGLTIIELIIVVVIIGITAAVGIPSFRSFTDSGNLTSATNSLIGAINYARSEAVGRGKRVAIGRSNVADGVGFHVWEENGAKTAANPTNADNAYNEGTDVILRVFDPFNESVTVTASAENFTFRSSGFLVTNNADSTITLCNREGDMQGKQITILTSGRTRVVDVTCQ